MRKEQVRGEIASDSYLLEWSSWAQIRVRRERERERERSSWNLLHVHWSSKSVFQIKVKLSLTSVSAVTLKREAKVTLFVGKRDPGITHRQLAISAWVFPLSFSRSLSASFFLLVRRILSPLECEEREKETDKERDEKETGNIKETWTYSTCHEEREKERSKNFAPSAPQATTRLLCQVFLFFFFFLVSLFALTFLCRTLTVYA